MGQSWHGSPHHSVNPGDLPNEICCSFTEAICYKHIWFLVLVTNRSAVEWDFSVCPFRGGSNHYTELRSRRSSQSHPDLHCRQENTDPDGMLVALWVITWPDLAQVLHEWEAASPTSSNSLWEGTGTGISFCWHKGTARAMTCHSGWCSLTHTLLWSLYLCSLFRMPDVHQLRKRRGGWLVRLQLALHGWEGAGS